MDTLAGFRDGKLAERVVEQIRRIAPFHPVKICHVCGTHEWTINHYGLRAFLPDSVDVIAGPGCPVCIVPAAEIDETIKLALEKNVTILTFGDLVRVPASEMSLQEAKAQGGDIRVVYSLTDAVKMAKKELDREFVFFAVGFETTTPSTAIEILKKPTSNLSFLVSHRLIPPAMKSLLNIEDLHIDGFIAPGHVSAIIGMKPYQIFPTKYSIPTVVAGFEPLDVLFAISMLLQQINEHKAKLENEYERVVTWHGNMKAQELITKVFDIVDGSWRGLGKIPVSALALNKENSEFDARRKYDVKVENSIDLLPGCLCHLVMVGKIKPPGCGLFMNKCTPNTPRGACMVSMEGTCRIWATHSP